MRNRTACFIVAAVIVAFVLSTVAAFGQGRGVYLPRGWKKLNLSPVQTEKILKIRETHQTKIRQLADEITRMKDEEQQQMVEVLTDAQKEALVHITVPGLKAAGKKAPPKQP